MTREQIRQCMRCCISSNNCQKCPLKDVPGCVSELIEHAYNIIEQQDVTILNIVNSFADKVKYAYSQYEEIMPEMFAEDVDDIAKEILYEELNNEY